MVQKRNSPSLDPNSSQEDVPDSTGTDQSAKRQKQNTDNPDAVMPSANPNANNMDTDGIPLADDHENDRYPVNLPNLTSIPTPVDLGIHPTGIDQAPDGLIASESLPPQPSHAPATAQPATQEVEAEVCRVAHQPDPSAHTLLLDEAPEPLLSEEVLVWDESDASESERHAGPTTELAEEVGLAYQWLQEGRRPSPSRLCRLARRYASSRHWLVLQNLADPSRANNGSTG